MDGFPLGIWCEGAVGVFFYNKKKQSKCDININEERIFIINSEFRRNSYGVYAKERAEGWIHLAGFE